MKSLIRRFFIQNFNNLTVSSNIKETEERVIRYDKMQKWYFDFVDKNECKCLNTSEDVLKALDEHKKDIENYILLGYTK